MTETKSEGAGRDEYSGSLTLPGETEPREVSLVLERELGAVTVRFDAPVAGATEWQGQSVGIVRRPRFDEVVFRTAGLPVETLELVWKLNASLEDNTLPGVIVPRPNNVKVTGDRGFILTKPL